MAADAGPDDDQIVVERLGRAPVVGRQGRGLEASAAGPPAEDGGAAGGGVPERGEPECLAAEAAEPEVDRRGGGGGGRRGRGSR